MSTNPQVDGVDVGTLVADTYEIVSILGRGGMGTVWEAHHNRLPGKRVAIKVLHPAVAEDADALARFRREAEIACRLGHPNIVEVHDFNTLDDGTPYLILELLEGQSLDARLKDGALDVKTCEHILRQVASALQCAHEQGVIHRDLKPQNIFLVPSPTGVGPEIAKVLDFGISKIRGSQTVKTQQSTLLGTPQYMAPEQATGQHDNVDATTDLFALSVMLYELLSGRAAFPGQNIPEVVYKVVHVEPEPIKNLVPSLPAEKAAALHKAMSKVQADRFASVAEFVEAFTGVPLPSPRGTPSTSTADDKTDAEASTVASTKMALGSAATLDSQGMATPVATKADDLASAATIDSQKTKIDAAIAATIDSSKLNIGDAQAKNTGDAGAKDTGDAGAEDTGAEALATPNARAPKTIAIRTLAIAVCVLAILGGSVWVLVGSGNKEEGSVARGTANSNPAMIVGDAASPLEKTSAEESADQSDDLSDDAPEAPAGDMASGSSSDALALASDGRSSGVNAGGGGMPAGSSRGRRGENKRGRRQSASQGPGPKDANSEQARQLLQEASAALKAGRYEDAILNADRAIAKGSVAAGKGIKVKVYCKTGDLANANGDMRGILKKFRVKRSRLKDFCKRHDITLIMD